MNKILIQLLLIITLINITGCKKTNHADNSLAEIRQRGVFVIGLDDSFAPMGFRDENNEIVGFDIDLAKEVASRLGLKFAAQPIQWSNKENELYLGSIDCIWNGLTLTDQREELFTVSKSYINNDQIIVVHKDSGIRSFTDMKDKTVGCQSGSTAEQAINLSEDLKKSLKEIILYQNNLNALDDLESNKIDGVVMDSIAAAYEINKTGKPFVILDEILKNESYGIAFRKGSVELCNAVQQTLQQMSKDSTIKNISIKWFGKDITVNW